MKKKKKTKKISLLILNAWRWTAFCRSLRRTLWTLKDKYIHNNCGSAFPGMNFMSGETDPPLYSCLCCCRRTIMRRIQAPNTGRCSYLFIFLLCLSKMQGVKETTGSVSGEDPQTPPSITPTVLFSPYSIRLPQNWQVKTKRGFAV